MHLRFQNHRIQDFSVPFCGSGRGGSWLKRGFTNCCWTSFVERNPSKWRDRTASSASSRGGIPTEEANIPKKNGRPWRELLAAKKALANCGGMIGGTWDEAPTAEGGGGGGGGRRSCEGGIDFVKSFPSSNASAEAPEVSSIGEWLCLESDRGEECSLVIETFMLLGGGTNVGGGFPQLDFIVAKSAALLLRHLVRRFWNHTCQNVPISFT